MTSRWQTTSGFRAAVRTPVTLGSLIVGLLALSVSAAPANDLAAFLERSEQMSTLNRSVRGDITIRAADGSSERAVIVIAPGENGAQFFATEKSGYRALMPLAWEPAGTAISGRGAKPSAIALDDKLAGTDLRGIDFFPFWKTDYNGAFISDENRLSKTVSLYAPKGRPYVLWVVEFDKAKLFMRTAKYYRDAFSNLVRIRNDSDHELVGTRPMPKKIVVHDYVENSETTFEIAWTVLDDAPNELTAKDSFATAPVVWPTAAP